MPALNTSFLVLSIVLAMGSCKIDSDRKVNREKFEIKVGAYASLFLEMCDKFITIGIAQMESGRPIGLEIDLFESKIKRKMCSFILYGRRSREF